MTKLSRLLIDSYPSPGCQLDRPNPLSMGSRPGQWWHSSLDWTHSFCSLRLWTRGSQLILASDIAAYTHTHTHTQTTQTHANSTRRACAQRPPQTHTRRVEVLKWSRHHWEINGFAFKRVSSYFGPSQTWTDRSLCWHRPRQHLYRQPRLKMGLNLSLETGSEWRWVDTHTHTFMLLEYSVLPWVQSTVLESLKPSMVSAVSK